MSELILTVDTSTPAGSVAVTRGENLLGEVFLNVKSTHTDRLLLIIDQLLSDLNIVMEELDAYGVVLGPGSFTGLRVGVATVKGLAIGTGKPILGVSSLKTLAMQHSYAPSKVCALIDARKKEVYGACFSPKGGVLESLGEEFVLPPDEVVSSLEGDVLFVGGGAHIYRSIICETMGQRAQFASWVADHPRASFAAALALEALRSNEICSLELLVPTYIRPSDAELMKAAG